MRIGLRRKGTPSPSIDDDQYVSSKPTAVFSAMRGVVIKMRNSLRPGGKAQVAVVCACTIAFLLASSMYKSSEINWRSRVVDLKVVRPVWWHAPFLYGSGYGFEAMAFVLGLYREGLVAQGRLWLSDHCGGPKKMKILAGMDDRTRKEMVTMLALGEEEFAKHDRSAIIVCESVPVCWSAPEPRKHLVGTTFTQNRCPPYPIEEAAYVIGRTMWETNRVHPDQVDRCNQMHEIWVPTKFNQEVYNLSGVVRPQLVVIPDSVDTHELDPAKHTRHPLPIGKRVFGQEYKAGWMSRPYTFLTIYDWGLRKGWDVLLRAYLTEFGPGGASEQLRPRVALFMLTKSFANESRTDSDFANMMHEWAKAELPRQVASDFEALPTTYLIHKHMSEEGLKQLYKAADAFVLPTRGEGWGRPFVEAMSMSLPIIATNWSAMTEYLDESVGYPLAVEALVPVPPGQWDWSEGNQRWAQPSEQHLRALMRHVVLHPAEAAAKGRAARARMKERYAPPVIARLVAARLQAIDDSIRTGNATKRWQKMGFVVGAYDDALEELVEYADSTNL